MDERITANGIDLDTGEWLVDIDVGEFARALVSSDVPYGSDYLEQSAFAARQTDYGLGWRVRPELLAETGWGVVFHVDEGQAVRDALAPLIDHRGRHIPENFVHVLDFLHDDDFLSWLGRHEGNPGNVDPRKVPYYLLLIGPPDRIPFDFQYLADVEYAVGRLDLDTPGDYERYALSLIEQETATTPLRDRTAVVFGTNHPWDRRATGLSAAELLTPLSNGHDGEAPTLERDGLRPIGIIGEAARQGALLDVLAGEHDHAQRPSLLFTASHGAGGVPPAQADRQRREHGALVCQDWSEPGPVYAESQTVMASHVADAHVHGLIAFLFACYGAGTPMLDEFPAIGQASPSIIAQQPFTAALPKALLAHPNGGALAVVAHVERAFPASIIGRGGTQITMYEDALGQIAAGRPVGHAMSDFNEKYAVLSTNLATELKHVRQGKRVQEWKLTSMWLERHDAQNFVVLGDPAVRIPR